MEESDALEALEVHQKSEGARYRGALERSIEPQQKSRVRGIMARDVEEQIGENQRACLAMEEHDLV